MPGDAEVLSKYCTVNAEVPRQRRLSPQVGAGGAGSSIYQGRHGQNLATEGPRRPESGRARLAPYSLGLEIWRGLGEDPSALELSSLLS